MEVSVPINAIFSCRVRRHIELRRVAPVLTMSEKKNVVRRRPRGKEKRRGNVGAHQPTSLSQSSLHALSLAVSADLITQLSHAPLHKLADKKKRRLKKGSNIPRPLGLAVPHHASSHSHKSAVNDFEEEAEFQIRLTA